MDVPLMVPLALTINTDKRLPRREERKLIEQVAAAAETTDVPLAAVFHVFDDRPSYYPLVLMIAEPDLQPGGGESLDRIVHPAVQRMQEAAAGVPIEFENLTMEEAMLAGNTADRTYSCDLGWTDRSAEVADLKRMVDGPPRRPKLGTAELMNALGALGRAPIMFTEPTESDRPRLLGVLLAAVEETLFLEAAENIAEVNHGYVEQLGAGADEGVLVLNVIAARMSLLAMLVDGNYGPERAGPILTAAGKTTAATAALMRLAGAGKLGGLDEGLLRQIVKDGKKQLQDARQAYEMLLRTLRAQGVKI